MERKRSFLGFLSVLFAMLFMPCAHADYSCPTYKKYSSCEAGYYLSDCGTTRDGSSIANPSVGNSCETCPDGYVCSGGTVCPRPEKITVSYNLNGGFGIASKHFCDWNAVCNLASITSTTLYRPGYKLKGWSQNKDATTGITTGIFTKNVTLYAIWEECGNGTYHEGNTGTAANTCTPCPEYWTSNPGATSKNECYRNVTLDANGGTLRTGTFLTVYDDVKQQDQQWSPSSSQTNDFTTCYYNVPCELPDASGLTQATADGVSYKFFSGWTTTEPANQTTAETTTSVRVTSKDETVTYYASKLPYYTITLDAGNDVTNAGTTKIYEVGNGAKRLYKNTDFSDYTQQITKTNGITIPSRGGYYFAGYKSGNNTYINGGGYANLSSDGVHYLTPEETITLGAAWEQLSTECAAGQYWDSKTFECASCPDGYPNSVTGALGIESCYHQTTTGEYITGHATDYSQVVTANCPSGDYCPSTKIYLGDTGGNVKCPNGYTSDAGAGLQEQCYITCAAGTMVETPKTNTCVNVPASNFWTNEHNVYYGQISGKNFCPSVTAENSSKTPVGFETDGNAGSINDCFVEKKAGVVLSKVIPSVTSVSVKFPNLTGTVGVSNITLYDENGSKMTVTRMADVQIGNSTIGSTEIFNKIVHSKYSVNSSSGISFVFQGQQKISRVEIYLVGKDISGDAGVVVSNGMQGQAITFVADAPAIKTGVSVNTLLGIETTVAYSFPIEYYTYTQCAAGTFSPAHSYYYGTADSCAECAGGSYSAAEAGECTACTDGKTTSVTAATSCDTDCGNNANAQSWIDAMWNTDNTVINSCTIEACDNGYYLENNVCKPNEYVVELDKNGGTKDGTTKIYTKYNTGIYDNFARTNEISSITIPERVYNVTFDANGGTAQHEASDTIFAYAGHYSDTNSNGTEYIDSDGIITDDGKNLAMQTNENITWYAGWSVESATDIPSVSERTGYTFDGWKLVGDTTGELWQDGEDYEATENATFIAQWTPVTYTITYELNGGNDDFDGATTYTVESAFELAEPTRNNSEFIGWYKDESLGGDAISSIVAGTTGNLTLYAGWDCVDGYETSEDGQSCVEKAPEVTCEAGEYLDGTICKECPANSYCTGGTDAPQSCPTDYPYSAAGAKSEAECYKTSTRTQTCRNDDEWKKKVCSDRYGASSCAYKSVKYKCVYYFSDPNTCKPSPDDELNGHCPVSSVTCYDDYYFSIADDLENGLCTPCTDLPTINSASYNDSWAGYGKYPAVSSSGRLACYTVVDLPCTPSVCPFDETGICTINRSDKQTGAGYLYYEETEPVPNRNSSHYLCPSTVDDGSLWSCFVGYTKNENANVDTLDSITDSLPEELCLANVYEFEVNNKGGEGIEALYYKYNDGWYSDADATSGIGNSVAKPEKTGHDFVGYYDKESLLEYPIVQITDNQGNLTDAAKIDENEATDQNVRTIYAIWDAHEYNVEYDADGGSGNAPTEPVSCTYDADCNAPENPYTKTGYTFAGWLCTGGDLGGNCDGDIIDANSSIKNATVVDGATIKLTAQWVANNYTIAFNANRPVDSSSDVSGEMADMSMTYDVAQNLTANAYKLTGWMFANWNTKADGSGTSYTNKESVENLTDKKGETVTLYAQWVAIKYTIAFDKNTPASASGDVSGEMADMSMTYDVTKNLTENAYKLTGWMFKGWLGSDGKTYTNGQSVNNLTTENSDTLTMSAQWEPNVYAITLNENFDGGTTTEIYQKYDTGWYSDKATLQTIDSVSVTDRGTAYKFMGFFDAEQGGTKVFDNELPSANTFAEDTTLYAQWETQIRECVPGKYYPRGNDESVEICPKDNYCTGVGAIMGDVSGCNQACPDNGLTDSTGTINITDCYRNFAEGDEYNGNTWNFENGNATWKCFYEGTKDDGLYSNCTINIKTCDSGYYNPDGSVACAQVTNGYYSGNDALTQTQCPQKDNYTVYSDGGRDGEDDCYVDCSTYTPDVTNSTRVELSALADATPHYSNGNYAACQYNVTCDDGYSAVSGAMPACNAKTYTVTLDRNGGNGTDETIECTFDGGKCALPAIDFERTGYVSGNKWCTLANGGGVCFNPGVAQNFSSTGDDITLYAVWTPGVFKVELRADDATENAAQGPVYLKYATGWYSDEAASKEISTIGQDNLPGKDNGAYVFAGYKLNDVMIIDGNGNLNKNALTVTAENNVATVVWGNGNTTCQPGTYYPGNGSECTVCPVNSYCPGGGFGTDSGKVGGLNECPKPISPHENIAISSVAASESASACNGVFPTYATDYAKGNWNCKYNESTKAYSDCDTDSVDITWCAGGYWYDGTQTNTDCVEVGIDSFSPESDMTKKACPNGGNTSGATTSDSVQDCSKTVDYASGSGNAKGTYVCFADTDNGDKTTYNARCDMNTVQITWCAGGHWYDETQTEIDCVEVGADHYSPEEDMQRYECPYGGTTTLTTAATPVGNCRMSVTYPNDQQTDLVVNGSGTQGCYYDSRFDDGIDNNVLNGYTLNCADAAITKCDAGYYWADRSNKTTPVCVPVDFGYFGPVADAGTSSLTARSQCPNNGKTNSDKSPDASACYREQLVCDIENGVGEQTCNWGEDAYDAKCTTCTVTECYDNFSQVGNECVGCPENHVCKDKNQYTCEELTGGMYTQSDAGTTNEANCFRDCALATNAHQMAGRDYYNATDTCKITMCVDGYTLVNGVCELCPAGSFCNTMDGTEPQSCPAEYPLSEPGASGQEDCFRVCEEYKVEYGTAIPTKDGTVYYGDTCEYTCISDTGNPGKISNERCIETSCNFNFEMIDGLCKLCNRENALSYKKTGNCVVESCVSGFHPTDQGCQGDVSTCDAPHATSAEQVWDYTLNAFSECIVKACEDGYHIDQNVCQSDVQPCEVENGVGTREWNHKKNAWGECVATSCEPGYTTDSRLTNEQWKQCGRCNNMYSAYGDLAASSYVRECEIAACMYQGEKYILENNECRLICTEFSDVTGSRRWDDRTKRCERTCKPGYVSW